MLSQHDPTRFELVGYAVRLLASAGRLREAQQLGEAALPARMEPAAEATLLLGLSEAFKHSGHNHAVVELTGRALGRGGLPAAVTAQLLAIRAHALLATGDLDAADQAAAEAVSRGVAAPEPGATVFGGVARSVVARARGQLDQAIAYAQEAVQTADELGGAARHRHPRLWLGRALSGADRFEEAERVYAAGQQEADLLATRWSQPLWHHNRAALVAARGHLADAQAWAEAGLRVAEQLAAWQMTVPLHALLSRLAVHRGALHEAAGHLQTAEQLIASGVTSASEGLWWAKGMLQEARGQDAAALGTLAGLIEQLPAGCCCSPTSRTPPRPWSAWHSGPAPATWRRRWPRRSDGSPPPTRRCPRSPAPPRTPPACSTGTGDGCSPRWRTCGPAQGRWRSPAHWRTSPPWSGRPANQDGRRRA